MRHVLHREGMAYALGGNPYGSATAEDERAVGDAIDVLGSSAELGDKAGILYGDAAGAALGWTQAGVAEHGGYRWAVDHAERRIGKVGIPSRCAVEAWNN